MSIVLSFTVREDVYFYYLLIGSLTSLFTVIYILFVLIFGLTDNRKSGNGLNGKEISKDDLTVVVPVYKEDPNIFEKVVSAIRKEKVKFIVVGDGCSSPYKEITDKNGGKFVYLKERGGKRKALREGLKYVKTPFVMFLDSDTILPRGSIEKLLSRFEDNVGAVSPEVSVLSTKSEYVVYISEMMQRLRDISYRALSKFGSMISVNGQCVIYKTELIKPFVMSSEFDNVKVLGFRTILGDDRQLTDYIYKRGYKVVIASDIRVKTRGPDSFKGLMKQLLRWYRSNNFFLVKEILDGSLIKKGLISSLVIIYWYTLPIFTLSLMLIKGGVLFRRLYLVAIHKGLNLEVISNIIKHEILRDLLPFILDNDGSRFNIKHHTYNALFHHLSFPSIHVGVNNLIHMSGLYVRQMEMLIHTLTTFHNYVSLVSTIASIIFLVAVVSTMENRSLKAVVTGVLAFPIMFISDVIALFTLWKQTYWSNR